MSDIRRFFDDHLRPAPQAERKLNETRYAAAALMIACAKADFEEDPDEEEAILDILARTFNLDEPALDRLVKIADMDTDTGHVTEFTELVNEHYSADQKLALLADLWRVADADGRIDMYEEQFIRRVARLVVMNDQQIDTARQKALGDDGES